MDLEKDIEKNITKLNEASKSDTFQHISYEEYRQLLEELIEKQIERLLSKED